MKRLSLLLLAGCLPTLFGAEPAPAPAPKAEASGPVEIYSDEADFELQERTFVYRGHVRASDPQMKLSCDLLTAWMAATNNQFTNIVAEGSVVIEVADAQGVSRATGGRAVYDAAANVVVITENPVLVNKFGTMTCDRVILDRARNRLHARGNVHIIMPPETLKQPSLVRPEKPPAGPAKGP